MIDALPDLDALEALANVATPGPWSVVENGAAGRVFSCATAWEVGTGSTGLALLPSEATARYVATTSPDVVLFMIQEIRRLRGLVRDAFCEGRSMQPGPVDCEAEWQHSDSRRALDAQLQETPG